MDNNNVILTGRIVSDLLLDHEYEKEKFYQCFVEIKRESGTEDVIPIIVSDRLINTKENHVGDIVYIRGEFRSFNHTNETGTHLLLYVFPLEIQIIDKEENENEIELIGFLCKKPTYRETPNGRKISDLIVAVNRRYDKSDYLPVVAWGRNAIYSSNLNVGDQIHIIGRIQSRNYYKNDQLCTAYELSVSKIEKV